MKPEDLSAMLKAEENYMDTLAECASGNARIDFSAGFRKGLAHRDAQPAPAVAVNAHVNETSKNEHDSADVLKRAPLVRLTDDEVAHEYNKADAYLMMTDHYEFGLVAKAIMDAMIAKNVDQP